MTKSVTKKSVAKQVKKPVKGRGLPVVTEEEAVAVADDATAAPASGAAPVTMASGADFSTMLAAASSGRASSYQAADSMSALGGGGSALPILGGVVVLGGLAAVAAGGGGSDTPPPPPANAAPTVAATQAVAGTEDKASTITVAGSDTNGDTLTYTAATPANGTVSVAGNVVTYTPKANFNGADTFKVTVADGKGGSAEQTVTVNVAAVNDDPVISATSTKTITVAEEGTAEIIIDATDIDSATLTPSITKAPTNGTVSVVGGKNVYTPKADFHGTDSFEVGVSDGTATTKYTVSVTVTPVGETVSVDVANDAAVTTYNAAVDTLGVADTFKFTDDSAKATNASITGMASGDVIEVTGASSDYSFTSVGNDILISYNNTTAGVLNQYTLVGLAAKGGAVIDEASAEAVAGFDFFNALTKSSGNGSGDGVAGANGDLDDDNDANAVTVASIAATAAADAYTENANVANSVKIVGFGAGDTITVSNASTSAYSFSSVGTDLTISYNNAGVVNDITIAGVVAAGTFIGSELDAETALGRDFFKDSTSGTTGTTSLDVGTDASRTALSGSTGAVTFSDNASVAGNVRISGFGIDDVIRVTGATESQYSFTSGDLDNDGSADDLSIVYNAGSGVVNDIQILNVVSASDFVFDKASAVSAVGFNFITFG